MCLRTSCIWQKSQIFAWLRDVFHRWQLQRMLLAQKYDSFKVPSSCLVILWVHVSRSIRVNRVSSACFAIPTSLEFRVQSRKKVSTKLIASTCSGTEKVGVFYGVYVKLRNGNMQAGEILLIRMGKCLQALRVWCWPLLKCRRSRTTEIRTSSSSPWTERVVWFPEVIKQTPEIK